VRYFERSNEKLLLRKFAAIKRNFSDIQLKSVSVFDVTYNHTAGRSMPECPIPVLIRLENNFYEINVKLKLKTKKAKNTGRLPIYLYSNSLRKEMFVL